jgi:hypothetical protein
LWDNFAVSYRVKRHSGFSSSPEQVTLDLMHGLGFAQRLGDILIR